VRRIPDNSIDLVITDPPYAKKYRHCYRYLADECPRIMKCGASLVFIAPHYLLEWIFEYFKGKLKYRWILNMNQFEGQHARMAMGIEVMWKPMLWYVKGRYPIGRGFLQDGIKTDQSKDFHEWEQDLLWCKYYIRKLTPEEGVVLDPYIGSGTAALASMMLNRRFIGVDSDVRGVELSRSRLNCFKTANRFLDTIVDRKADLFLHSVVEIEKKR